MSGGPPGQAVGPATALECLDEAIIPAARTDRTQGRFAAGDDGPVSAARFRGCSVSCSACSVSCSACFVSLSACFVSRSAQYWVKAPSAAGSPRRASASARPSRASCENR